MSLPRRSQRRRYGAVFEHTDPSTSFKQSKTIVCATKDQLKILNDAFEVNRRPQKDAIQELVEKTQLYVILHVELRTSYFMMVSVHDGIVCDLVAISDFRWISSWFVRRRKSAIRDKNSASSFDPLKKEPVFSTNYYPSVDMDSSCLPASEDLHSKENTLLLPTMDESFCKHGPLCSACSVDPTVLFHRKLSRASYMHSTPFASAYAPNVMLMPPLPSPTATATASTAREADLHATAQIGPQFRTVPPAESLSLGYIPAAFPMNSSLASPQPHQNFSCCPPDGPSTGHNAFGNAPALNNNSFIGSEQFTFTYTRQSFVPFSQPDDASIFDRQVSSQDLRLPDRHFDGNTQHDQSSLPRMDLSPSSSRFYEPQMPDLSAVTKDLPFSEIDWKALGFTDLENL